MKYQAEFTSIDNVNYKVEIETPGSGTQQITLGGTPFVTSMKESPDNIYEPVKGSTATVEVVTGDYMFDLYTGNAQGVKVTLTNTSDNVIEWVGYVSPRLYDMGFTEERETIEVEAVDTLSTLGDIVYRTQNKETASFLTILLKILIPHVKARYLYVSDNVQLASSNGTDTILDKLSVSELNFFDEKTDENVTDDDVAWTCLEVLEEICRYLGYTVVMVGEDVYMLDYDAIKSKSPYYYRYDLTKYASSNGSYTLNSAPARVSLTHTHKIVGSDHSSSSAKVSLNDIYNKISVKADTYTVDDTIADLTSRLTNVTCTDATAQGLGVKACDAAFFETIQDDDNPGGLLAVWMDVHNDEAAHGGGKHNYTDFCAAKYMRSPNCKWWVYDSGWNDVTSRFQDNITYSTTKEYNMAILAKYYTKNVGKDKTGKTSKYIQLVRDYNNAHKNDPSVTTGEFIDKLAKAADITSLSWTDGILISLPSMWSAWYEKRVDKPSDIMAENMKYPMFQIECDGAFTQGGDKSAALITGDVYFHCIGGGGSVDAYPAEKNGWKVDKGNWIYPPEDWFVTASIQWGNQWWNGESWQSTKCGFPLYWGETADRDNESKKKKDTIDAWKASKMIMEFHPISNTVTWRFGTTERGHLVTMPTSGTVSGKPILTIYRPHQPRLWKSRKDYNNGDKQQKCRWPSVFLCIKGLEFKSIMGDPTYSDINESDTVYTNELENDTINELDCINYKVHTFDNKDNSYGSVSLAGGDFADKLYNRALYSSEKNWEDHRGEKATNGMRQEEHLIFKLCKQYGEPAKVLDFSLHIGDVRLYGLYTDTTIEGDYIVNTTENDYRNDELKVKLIEKK